MPVTLAPLDAMLPGMGARESERPKGETAQRRSDAPVAAADSPSVAPKLRALRERSGMTQLDLAERVGVTRQSLYAIEQGRAQPSVGLALRIARALGTSVEELFDEEPAVVEVPGASEGSKPGERVLLGWVGEQRVALALDRRSTLEAHRAADGVVSKIDGKRLSVELFAGDAPRDTLFITGCAPALAVLAEQVNGASGQRAVWLPRTSLDALDLLRRNQVHIAGVHLVDDATGEANVPFVKREIPRRHLLLFNLATWEQGFVLARGNPRGIRDGSDLSRRKIRVAQREPGAAAQLLLARVLELAGSKLSDLAPPALVAAGHLEIARFVAQGIADVGVAHRSAAMAYGLDFIPLSEERFDLVVPKENTEQSSVGRLLDALRRYPFRRELDALGGYGTSRTGELVAEIRRG